MGYCTAFALALNEIFGYDIYKIKKGKHYFCYKVIDKDKIRLIDVRGVFDKEESFLNCFNATIKDIEKDNGSVWEDEYIKFAKEYAKAIIYRFEDYYKII